MNPDRKYLTEEEYAEMIQKIKGTMDILPDETPLFRYIEGIMREEAEKKAAEEAAKQ